MPGMIWAPRSRASFSRRGAGGASGTEHHDAGALDGTEPPLQRADDSSCVRIEAVKLAVLSPDHGIAGADLCSVGVGIVEMGQHAFFVGHGDAEAIDGNVTDAGQ